MDAPFQQMDAVDGNLAMLEKIKDKGIYLKTYHAILGDKDRKICEDIQDGSYDVAVIVGGFGQSHLPVNSLHQVYAILGICNFYDNIIAIYVCSENSDGKTRWP